MLRRRARQLWEQRRIARGERVLRILNFSWVTSWLWHIHPEGRGRCPVPGCDGTKPTLVRLLMSELNELFFGQMWPVVAESKWMDTTTMVSTFVLAQYLSGLLARAICLGLGRMRRPQGHHEPCSKRRSRSHPRLR